MPTPEERLLRLLRAKPRETVPATAGQAAATVPPRLGRRGLQTPREAIGRWPQWAAGVLAVLIAVELAALAYHLVRPASLRALPPESEAQAPREPAPQPLPLPSLAAASARPLFVEPTGVDSDGAGGKAAQAPSGLARQLATRLNLLGIVAGDTPQAIIEDTQTQKTYFLTTGQTVVEGAVVQEIRETRVILNLAGEPIELTL